MVGKKTSLDEDIEEYGKMADSEAGKIMADIVKTPLDNVFDAHHESEVVLRGVTKKEYDRMVRKIRKRGPAWMHDFEWAILPDSEKRFFYRMNNLLLQLVLIFAISTIFVWMHKFPGPIAWLARTTADIGYLIAALVTMLALYMEYVSHKKAGVDEYSRED